MSKLTTDMYDAYAWFWWDRGPYNAQTISPLAETDLLRRMGYHNTWEGDTGFYRRLVDRND